MTGSRPIGMDGCDRRWPGCALAGLLGRQLLGRGQREARQPSARRRPPASASGPWAAHAASARKRPWAARAVARRKTDFFFTEAFFDCLNSDFA